LCDRYFQEELENQQLLYLSSAPSTNLHLASKVFLTVDWEPLSEVAGPLVSRELQVALLHTRQMKY